MYSDKTQLDSRLDLTHYLEGLFQQDEADVETGTIADAKEDKSSLVSEFDNDTETEQDRVEQSPIPVWGQKPFECLLIKSAGMDMMLPTMSVSHIERADKKISRLPVGAEVFHGVITSRDRTLAVMDLFSLITGNASADKEQSLQHSTHHIDHVIVMNDGSYALVCDDISRLITLNPEDVRWNRASFNNPMFAGIVTEYLCPIVNIDNLTQQVSAMPIVQSLNNNA